MRWRFRRPVVDPDVFEEQARHVTAIATHLHNVEHELIDLMELVRTECRTGLEQPQGRGLDGSKAEIARLVDERVEALRVHSEAHTIEVVRLLVSAHAEALRAHGESHATEVVARSLEPLEHRLRRVDRILGDLGSSPRAPLPNATEVGIDPSPRSTPGSSSGSGGRRQDSSIDRLYESIEARFRGSSSAIALLQSEYAELVESWGELPGEFLDIGCGKGEFLDVLSKVGVPARGVDLNPGFVENCREDGFAVDLTDGLSALREVSPGALRGVSAFHVVEHLSTEELMDILAAARRAIHPGGGLILETPNPENLIVGATTFWLDPTHRKPIPPALLSLMVSEVGFEDVKIGRVHAGESLISEEAIRRVPDDYQPALRTVVELISGPMDYYVTGRSGTNEN